MRVGDVDEAAQVDRDRLGRVLDTVRELGTISDLGQTLDAVAHRVCELGDFGSSAINVALPSGDVRVEAVAGGATELLGQTAPLATWLEILDAASRWRDLRFYRHDQDQSPMADLATWDPPAVEGLDPDDDGAWHPEDLLLAPMWAADGSLIGVLSVDEPRDGRYPDTEQLTVLELFAAQAGRAIADAARRARSDDRASLFASAFDGAATAMAIIDSRLRVVSVNRAALPLLRLAPSEARGGEDLTTHLHPDDADEVVGACRAALARRGGRASVECRLADDGGPDRWVRAQVARVESAIDAPRLVANLEDVTESRRTLAELRHQAGHDVLTGLPNRRSAYDLMERALADQGDLDVVWVLACDLDGFKAVNDRHGHACGDDLLAHVARRLERVLGPGDVLARLGGDEFVVIATHPHDGGATALAERCVVAVRPPFVLAAATCHVTLSAGVARADALLRPNAASVFDLADQALYRAKADGRDRWVLSSA